MEEEDESSARPGRDGPEVVDRQIKKKTILSKFARKSRIRSRNLMASANLLIDREENAPDRTDLRWRVSSKSPLTPWAKRTVRNNARSLRHDPVAGAI